MIFEPDGKLAGQKRQLTEKSAKTLVFLNPSTQLQKSGRLRHLHITEILAVKRKW